MTEQLPSNSHRVAAEKKEAPLPAASDEDVQPIIVGSVIRRKPSFGRRMAKMFFSGDGDSVISFIVKDVLVPAVQDLFIDVVTKGIQKSVYGDVRPGQQSSRTTRQTTIGRPLVGYNQVGPTRPTSAVSSSRPPLGQRPQRREVGDIDDIVLDRLDAEAVITELEQTIGAYGVVTVARLYKLINEPVVYTDHYWGWTNLDGADISRAPGGWRVSLPPIEDIRR